MIESLTNDVLAAERLRRVNEARVRIELAKNIVIRRRVYEKILCYHVQSTVRDRATVVSAWNAPEASGMPAKAGCWPASKAKLCVCKYQ